jgi:DNA-binding transcriptional LysR family regulator
MTDLRQLRYFIAVAEEGNVHRAAIRLHVSQPPLTRHIKTLEDSLGVQLFRRTHWGVELTQAGQQLLAEVRHVHALIDHAVDRARRTGRGESGRLDIGIFGSGALSLVPQVLRRYSVLHPDVQIVLLNVAHEMQVEALRQRRLLATFDRFLLEDEFMKVEIVARENQLVALQKSSPLAKRSVVPMEALATERFIVSRHAAHAHSIATLCRANGFELRVAQEAGEMVAGLALVANGYGVQIVPESIRLVSMPGLVYRPIRANGDSTIELQCAYRRDENSPLLAALLGVVREFFRSRPNSVRP